MSPAAPGGKPWWRASSRRTAGRRARQQRRRAGQIDGNRSRRSRMGPVGTRRAYTNPCLGSGRKAAGAMLEYARYSRSSTSFSSMSESRSLLRISRSRPPDRVSSTAIRRENHAPGTRMVRDEPYSLGNGDGQRPTASISGGSRSDAVALSLITAGQRDAGAFDTSRRACRKLARERPGKDPISLS